MGTLFIVATPVGNLEDITLRAIRTLKEVDRIACEDTRETQKLLQHYGIQKPLVSYHDHNESARAGELVEKLQSGENIALVSDAGTPLVADPGYRLVRAATGAGIRVIPIPGPSALLSALSASGLPTDAFRFCGFLPAKSGQRRTELERLLPEQATLVFYEAPHRILETLADISQVMGERELVLGRELTKIHEEFLRGTPAQLLEKLQARPAIKGEITLLVAKAGQPEVPSEPVREAVEKLERAGLQRMEAIKQVARERGLSKREVYRELI